MEESNNMNVANYCEYKNNRQSSLLIKEIWSFEKACKISLRVITFMTIQEYFLNKIDDNYEICQFEIEIPDIILLKNVF